MNEEERFSQQNQLRLTVKPRIGFIKGDTNMAATTETDPFVASPTRLRIENKNKFNIKLLLSQQYPNLLQGTLIFFELYRMKKLSLSTNTILYL